MSFNDMPYIPLRWVKRDGEYHSENGYWVISKNRYGEWTLTSTDGVVNTSQSTLTWAKKAADLHDRRTKYEAEYTGEVDKFPRIPESLMKILDATHGYQQKSIPQLQVDLRDAQRAAERAVNEVDAARSRLMNALDTQMWQIIRHSQQYEPQPHTHRDGTEHMHPLGNDDMAFQYHDHRKDEV